MSDAPADRWVTLVKAQEILGVSRATVKSMRDQGIIKRSKLHPRGWYKYDREELLKLLEPAKGGA